VEILDVARRQLAIPHQPSQSLDGLDGFTRRHNDFCGDYRIVMLERFEKLGDAADLLLRGF
jgi:hypothetical protein